MVKKVVRRLRILNTVTCPLSIKPVELSECKRCQWNRGITGYHILDPKVVCGRSIEEIPAEFAVFCPMVEKMIPLRKCLNCGHMKWFYGFHDENPTVYCNYG